MTGGGQPNDDPAPVPVSLEQDRPSAVGEVTARLVIDKRAVGHEDVDGGLAVEEREPAPRYDRLVELVHGGLVQVVRGGVHVVVVREHGVAEDYVGREADLQRGSDISPGGEKGCGWGGGWGGG